MIRWHLKFGVWCFDPVPLPDLIEIVPLEKPVKAEITVPGSKSITNRALVLAALAEGEITLRGALWSEDTQVMVDGLQKLGFAVAVEPDPNEMCNRTITVQGLGGKIPNAGTLEKPLELFVGNAGTAARFLTALVCLGHGIYRLHGVKRMHERPQEALFDALRELGYCLDSVNNKLPVLVHGSGPKPDATCCVSIAESSQFASGLLLCAKAGAWHVNVVGENAEESPYVTMTADLIKVFPGRGGEFEVEPDASSGSYFWAADWVLWVRGVPNKELGQVVVRRWPKSGWQIDERYPGYRNLVELKLSLSRKIHLGDSIMTAIVKAPLNRPLRASQSVPPVSSEPFGGGETRPVQFTDLGRLRLQETERVLALKNELAKCGAKVVEEGDALTVYPSKQLHGAEIETYNDHRMAMCFAILGLKVPGIKIKNPACVKKTFPNFFQKLAAPPPRGLGATILDPATGRKLDVKELFAD
jgi:3-phosphoshikimate 1-carboxyvinyltransferase